MTTWSTTETVITWQSQDDASITFQVVKQNGGTGGGTGDVVGPASSVDGRAVLFDGTTGKLIKQASAAPMLVGDAPTAHAASHQDGGSDELALDASQTTSGQFNVARLGIGTPTAFTFLDGTGAWTSDVPVFVPVKNTTASTIAKGAPVYATGTVGATSTIEIAPADADDSAKMPAIGLTESQLVANATGYVIVVGTLKGVDTSAYTINQALYVSTTAGQLTGTKPTGASELIQNIGRITRVNSNNGEILVLGPGRTNDVPNAIDAGKLTSGTVATARLASGTANSSSYLRGDQTWATITAGDVVGPASSVDGRVALFDGTTGKLLKQSTAALAPIATSGSGSDITTGTVAVARLATQAAPTSTPFTTNDWVPLWTGWGTGAASIGTAGTATASNSTARYQPVWIGQSVSVTGLGIDVAAANAGASAVVRLGIHANSSGRPGDVVVDAGTASLNTAVAKELTFSSVSLSPGWYWIVIATQSLDTAGTNPTFRAITSGTSLTPRTAVPSATASQDAVLTATVSGALANGPTVSTSTTNVQAFKIWGKFA